MNNFNKIEILKKQLVANNVRFKDFGSIIEMNILKNITVLKIKKHFSNYLIKINILL